MKSASEPLADGRTGEVRADTGAGNHPRPLVEVAPTRAQRWSSGHQVDIGEMLRRSRTSCWRVTHAA